MGLSPFQYNDIHQNDKPNIIWPNFTHTYDKQPPSFSLFLSPNSSYLIFQRASMKTEHTWIFQIQRTNTFTDMSRTASRSLKEVSGRFFVLLLVLMFWLPKEIRKWNYLFCSFFESFGYYKEALLRKEQWWFSFRLFDL